MRDVPSIVSFFSIAIGFSMFIGAAILDIKPPTKDAFALQECTKIHPIRYCQLTYGGLQK